jgi:predicted ATPase/serine/threonine protein kinase
MELSANHEIDGRYRVEGPLGSGGMATVWRVRHIALGTAHALKVLHNTAPEIRERLLEEGRIQARLQHPNIVRVTDVVALPGGVGLVMDLVEGPSLRALLSRERLPLEAAVSLGAAILDGVAFAHAQGLAHRDLKPENILLADAGGRYLPSRCSFVPRVADFGLAKVLARGGLARTRAGLAMGTPGYMAPEQYRDASTADARADVFSLGVILYELTTGQRPFDGTDLIALYQQSLRGEFLPPGSQAPTLSTALSELIAQALRPRAAERFADAGALATRWRQAAGLTLPTDSLFSTPASPPPTPSVRTTAETLDLMDLLSADVPTVRQHNLPPPQDDFVGRTEERARLGALLSEGRTLLTVLGPGGIGKTRLVLELARGLSDVFQGGVWFCDLSEARSAEGVCLAVAGALEVPLDSADPTAQLGHALAGRGRALVVLDNFEQLAEYAAQTLGRWRRRAPEVVFVVTSRAVLGLPGEQVFNLEPLPLPPAGAGGAALAAGAAESAAVALFVSRARARKASFALTPENAADVVALVRLLDGLPLAIELAAARAGMLSPAAMVSRMGQRFRLLQGARRGGPDRQSALRSAIDWSWELLEGWEQAAFAQLSVFEGGFTLEAAEAVLDLSEHEDAGWPMDAVQALVDRSLVRALGDHTPDGRPREEPRFGLYLSLQQYAAEKLSGEREALEERHSAYFAGFGEPSALASLRTRGGVARWWALREELDNLAVAARRAAERGAAREAVHAALALAEVLQQQGPLSVAVEALERAEAVALAAGAADHRRAALTGLGELRRAQGRLAPALEHYEAALALHREAGDRTGEGVALGNLGLLYLDRGKAAEARAHLEAALAIHREVGNRRGEGIVLGNLGVLESGQGRRAEARAHLEAALAIHRAIGNRAFEGRVLGNLGRLYTLAGELEAARDRYEAALEVHRAIGNRRSEGITLGNLGGLYVRLGELERGCELLEGALAIHREVGNRPAEAQVSGNLGITLRDRGQPAAARPHLRAAIGLFGELGDARTVALLEDVLGSLGEG